MRVLVTGANGFIGKNLVVRLNELGAHVQVYTRMNSIQDLPNLVNKVEYIVHLAGENRPKDKKSFSIVNAELTLSLCEAVRSTGKKIPIILASSTQTLLDNAYGKSKLDAEVALKEFERNTGNPVYIYRLPGVFGKWCKPNYNSVVATFCHNISHDLPIQINDPSSELSLVYVDDVVEEFVSIVQGKEGNNKDLSIQPKYKITLGELADYIKRFYKSRDTLISERVGSGLIRKLYSTYVSYLSPENFSYSIPTYTDERGMFAEMFKTQDSGQFSFFTIEPGLTRGGHYHHSKTEKFMVIKGAACFKFRHIVTNETYEIITNENQPTIVDTAPGWAHNITNIGGGRLIAILWANEVFDKNHPDTIEYEV
jgi:UDP-2-acetamido-2,6-beta-L-arabino-hexul-4-ose reductase